MGPVPIPNCNSFVPVYGRFVFLRRNCSIINIVKKNYDVLLIIISLSVRGEPYTSLVLINVLNCNTGVWC